MDLELFRMYDLLHASSPHIKSIIYDYNNTGLDTFAVKGGANGRNVLDFSIFVTISDCYGRPSTVPLRKLPLITHGTGLRHR